MGPDTGRRSVFSICWVKEALSATGQDAIYRQLDDERAMTPTILRSVLIVAMMLGIGVIANIFSSQQHQHAARSDKGAGRSQTIATKRTIARTTHDQRTKARRLVQAVRRELESRGYLTAPAPDPTGVAIKAAILAFEFDHNLRLTALPSDAVLKALIFTHTAKGGARRVRPRTAAARDIVGEVQRALAHLGYGQPNITAELDTATRKAIRKFERARGLQVSGRVSAPLVARLGPAFDATQVGHADEASPPNAG